MRRGYQRPTSENVELMTDALIGIDRNSPLVAIAGNLDRIATALEELLERQEAAEERAREGR